jgi:hypothetical protein
MRDTVEYHRERQNPPIRFACRLHTVVIFLVPVNLLKMRTPVPMAYAAMSMAGDTLVAPMSKSHVKETSPACYRYLTQLDINGGYRTGRTRSWERSSHCYNC